MEVLRATGEHPRIVELLELSHHSLAQYWLLSTADVIPLLQIAPSRTGTTPLTWTQHTAAD